MKILVPIKRVIDYKATVRIKADGSAVETANMKMSMNPFDEIALEEALRLKEKGLASEVITISIGPELCQETLRTSLAMGADRAQLLQTDVNITPLTIAKLLAKVVTQENTELVILGKQAIDSDDNQVGQMLAALLNWAQGTFISKLDLTADHAIVTREIDGGLQTLRLKLPAVITTDLRLNEPRYISLPNIMKAKSKPLTIIPATDLQIDLNPKQHFIRVAQPERRRAGVKVETVQELVKHLKQDAQVL